MTLLTRRSFFGRLFGGFLAAAGCGYVTADGFKFRHIGRNALITPDWVVKETAIAFERNLRFASTIAENFE